MPFTIDSDQATDRVWVNNEVQCVARFSPFMYEVYSANGQELVTQKIFDKAVKLNEQDFAQFCESVKQTHDVTIDKDLISFEADVYNT